MIYINILYVKQVQIFNQSAFVLHILQFSVYPHQCRFDKLLNGEQNSTNHKQYDESWIRSMNMNIT